MTELSPLTVTLAPGHELAALLSDVASGRVNHVRLEGVTADNITVYDLRLADATITNYFDANGQDQLRFDEYARVGLISHDANGSNKQSFGWDVATNSTINFELPKALPGSTAGIIPEPVKYYLTIDGIDGGSTAAGHVGAFEISAYAFEISFDPPLTGGGGGGAGVTELSPLTVTLAPGHELAALLSDVASGRVNHVRLEGVTADNVTVYDLRLADATITNYFDANGQDQLRFDEYARVGLISQQPGGSQLTKQVFGWDVATNTTINSELPTPTTGISGDDTLTGGPGADTFVFRSGDGTDTVTDFSIAEGDKLYLSVAGISSFSDLQGRITQQGTSTIITLGSGLVLENFDATTLTSAQFLFNRAATDIALSNASVAENSAAGTVVGTLSAIDADIAESFVFSLVDDAGGRFSINGTNLVVAAALDYEAAVSHGVTVQVTDSAGNVFDESITLDVTNVNEVPVGIADGANVNEDASILIDVLANDTDVDLGDTLTFISLSGSTSTLGASISVENGQVRYTADADAFDLATFAGITECSVKVVASP